MPKTKGPLSSIASAGQKPEDFASILSAHPRRHDHLVVMMVMAMMVCESHFAFDPKDFFL